jgi:hypothetical protein
LAAVILLGWRADHVTILLRPLDVQTRWRDDQLVQIGVREDAEADDSRRSKCGKRRARARRAKEG